MGDGILEHERGQICPICGTALARRYPAPQAGGSYDVDCTVCGQYRISSALEDRLADATTRREFGPVFPFLRAHIRQATDRAEMAEVTLANYETLARGHMGTPVDSQLRRALELVARRSRLGDWVELDLSVEAFRLDATSDVEVQLLLEHLQRQMMLDHRNQKPPFDAVRNRIDEH